MIVCSCNVLSDTQILATLRSEEALRPRTPAQAYKCLGCAARCGRCVATVRALLANARGADCEVGCAICPGHHQEAPQADNDRAPELPFLIAAE